MLYNRVAQDKDSRKYEVRRDGTNDLLATIDWSPTAVNVTFLEGKEPSEDRDGFRGPDQLERREVARWLSEHMD